MNQESRIMGIKNGIKSIIHDSLFMIHSRGFTLIELLIVIAVIGVLAAGILVAIDPADKINAANDSKVQNDVSNIGRAAESYATQQLGSYPATAAELVAYGELKKLPVPPATAYGASYTYTALPVDACSTIGRDCTSITVTSPLLSKKYTSAGANTPFWRYESATGKSCAVTTETTACGETSPTGGPTSPPVSATPILTPTPAPVTNGLVLWLPLNEETGIAAGDISGFGNNGIISGGAAWTTGYISNALGFNGNDGRIYVTDSPSLNPTQITIELWAYPQASGKLFNSVIAKGPMDESYALYYVWPDNYLTTIFTVNGVRYYFNTPDGSVPVSQWIHIAATFDGSTGRTYLNGTESVTLSRSGNLTPNARELLIGEWADVPDRNFQGTIDNVRIYNRALSPAEILQNYDSRL